LEWTPQSDGIAAHPNDIQIGAPIAKSTNMKESSKIVKVLPVNFYDQFLSKAAKERMPSPSEYHHHIYMFNNNGYLQFVVCFH